MPSNIEIKAKIENFSAKKQIAESLTNHQCQIIIQEDIFFNCKNGRLKLRILSGTHGELIYYERPDVPAIKQSNYVISKTDNPYQLKEILSKAFDVKVIVKKKRHLFLVNQTRIHLDEVEELGNFLELEVVIEPHQDTAEGYLIVKELMEILNIDESDLISKAYADLILEKISYNVSD